jgi:hypothetical protein
MKRIQTVICPSCPVHVSDRVFCVNLPNHLVQDAMYHSHQEYRERRLINAAGRKGESGDKNKEKLRKEEKR